MEFTDPSIGGRRSAMRLWSHALRAAPASAPKELLLRTLAHLSDLHIGKSAANDDAARDLCRALLAAGVDHVLASGDLTHRGRLEELAAFRSIFAPLQDRMAVVPGNHDRLGDDAGRRLMAGRIQVASSPGIHLVRVDSTAPHNRSLLDGHGQIAPREIDEVERAAAASPRGSLCVVMLHHHLYALPEDHLYERLARLVGWPNAGELPLGRELLERLAGRCDLVLHGHRHALSELTIDGPRPLRVLNAGASPDLGRVRVVAHVGGRVAGERWLDASRGGAEVAAWALGLHRPPGARAAPWLCDLDPRAARERTMARAAPNAA